MCVYNVYTKVYHCVNVMYLLCLICVNVMYFVCAFLASVMYNLYLCVQKTKKHHTHEKGNKSPEIEGNG